MALQFIDGFDHYYLSNTVPGGSAATAQKWDSSFFAGEMYPQANSGRFGTGNRAMRLKATVGNAWITKNVPTNRDELIVGFAFLPAATSSHETQIRFGISTGEALEMRLNLTTDTINVVSEGGGGVNAVSGSILTNNVWQYIELRVKVHATLGEVEVRLDGTVIHNLTNQNTGTTGGVITTLTVEARSNLMLDWIDDLYLLDTTGSTNNDFLGDVRVDVLHPDGNGTNNDFTLFTDATQSYDISSNFEAVQNEGDITIGRDHNYVESGLVGASEDYDNHSLADIGVTPSNIFGVQVVNNAKKTDTGVIKYKDEMVIAGTAYDDGTVVTATSGDYSMTTFIRDTDPSDDATWTAAKVNAVGSGFTITFREV